MQECLQACSSSSSSSSSAHGHRALIVGKPRGKTWMLFPRRAAEELQPSAFSKRGLNSIALSDKLSGVDRNHGAGLGSRLEHRDS
jgi:hypothetical protein